MLHIRQHVHQKLYTGDRLAYSNIMHAKCQQVSKVIISMIIHGDISTVTIITMIMIIIVMIRMIIIILMIALFIYHFSKTSYKLLYKSRRNYS